MNKGITMTSVVVYVALFFVFSALAVTVSTNMNYEALSSKGSVINSEKIQKLQFNMLNSAKESTLVYNINGRIVFSNNDEYYYDSEKKEILKNDSVLISNVESLNFLDISEFSGDVNKAVYIEISVQKYGNIKTQKLLFSVGDDIE